MVLDTNVVVSALLQPLGPSASVVQLALSRVVQPCLSEPILAEYEDVLRRPRLRRDAELVERFIASLKGVGALVKPGEAIQVCADPDDNVFLECAEAAEADYLVTGNKRDFPEKWKKTKIVTPRDYLIVFSEM